VFVYHAAGLTMAADAAIPWFPLARAQSRPPDLFIHVQEAPAWAAESKYPQFVSEYHDDAGRPIVAVDRSASGVHFAYADGTCFWIDQAAAHIWTVWCSPATLTDAATYLAGPVFSCMLRMRGALALHASAIQVGAVAVAFIGGHGAGKSTTAAAFARRGYPVVTDDVLRTDRVAGTWHAAPFLGPLRLWPDAARLVNTDALPPLTAGWAKQALAMGTYDVRPADRPLPIGGLLLLRPRVSSDVVPAVESCTPAEALVQLAAHTSAAQLLDPVSRANEFRLLSDLVRSVPAAFATAHADGDRLQSFVTSIAKWTATTARDAA
jgi:hypothetical protein